VQHDSASRDPRRVQRIVVVGGGTAGWMAAATLAKTLGRVVSIHLVESDEIGTVGVGEASVPHLRWFNTQLLGLDEADFVRQVKGTFKLGIQFRDWARLGDAYFHGFGQPGQGLGAVPFHHYWLKLHQDGRVPSIDDYSLQSAAAIAGKFLNGAPNLPPNSPLHSVVYAYHFDAGLYARYLRGYSEKLGVRRTEGKIVDVSRRGDDGFIEAVVLQGGERIEGDFFIDCSGFRGLLIEETLQTGYVDWSHWLPCDRAIAVPTASPGPPLPYTRATARRAGWQWRIPLQHRIGNGHVFSSRFMSEDEATAELLRNLDGETLLAPRVLRFTTGMRRKFWNGNVLALGLASGFMEPLESTSIVLVQMGITRFVEMFPGDGVDTVSSDRYNALLTFEYERIRDFLILHYHATERDDSAFWNYCRTMPIPDSLQNIMDLFRRSGLFFRNGEELFALSSWVQVMLGQRIVPARHHAAVEQMPDAEVVQFVGNVREVIAACVQAMPTHQAFIDRYCKAA